MNFFPARLLVDLPNWLGDFVHTLPALQVLLAANHKGKTLLLVPQAHVPLAQTLGVETLARPAKASWRWIRQVLQDPFDIALTARHSIRAKLLLVGTRARHRLASADRGARWLGLQTFPVHRGRHQRHDLDGALSLLGLRPVGEEPARFALSAACLRQGESDLAALTGAKRAVAICPGARHRPEKRYPVQNFVEAGSALRKAGWEVLAVGGPEEEALLAVLAVGCGGKVVPPTWPLDRVAGVLAACDVVVGNDSGLTHLAAAVGCRTVMLHGPTQPSRTGPSGRAWTLQQNGPKGLPSLSPQRIVWAVLAAAAREDLRVSHLEAMIRCGGGPLAQLAEQGTLNP